MTAKVKIASGNIFGAARRADGKQPSVADEIRERQRLVEGLATSIFTMFNVVNLLVWENPRTGTQHWRDDCPALRRAKLGEAKVLNRASGMTQPCGRCAQVERDERVRTDARRVAELLALEPPNFEPLQIEP